MKISYECYQKLLSAMFGPTRTQCKSC